MVRRIADMIRLGRKGSVMVTALLVAAILLILAIAYTSRIVSEYMLTSRSYYSTVAINLAEAGAEQAIWELNYNGAWTGWASGAGGAKTLSFTSLQGADGETMGGYIVAVTFPAGSNTAVILSTGIAPHQTQPNAQRTVRVVLRKSIFSKGIISLESLRFTGNSEVDSFDSGEGPYSVLNRGQPNSENGDIASNGDITLIGNTHIYGNATPGPGHAVLPAPPPPPNVTGTTTPADGQITLDPIPATVMTNAQSNNNNAAIPSKYIKDGGLKMTGNDTLDLGAGVYYFTSVQIAGNAKITFSGPAQIFVDGGSIQSTGNGFYNDPAIPTNLFIYSTGNSISFTGNATYSGAIYAPNADIRFTGNAGVYGALSGKSVTTVGNANIHYDLALNRAPTPFGDYRIFWWQEK